nr:hypothetical transcript [Hymenolepis microstoma]
MLSANTTTSHSYLHFPSIHHQTSHPPPLSTTPTPPMTPQTTQPRRQHHQCASHSSASTTAFPTASPTPFPPPSPNPPPIALLYPPASISISISPPQANQLRFQCMGCHRDFTTEYAWRSHLQFLHPPSQLASPPAILASHGVAFMAPPLPTSTPKKFSPCLLHTKTHSALPSSVTHTAPNSPSPHTSPPSPLKPLPPSPSSLHAAHGGTHAHATGDATAMSCSRFLSASPQFTQTISTINSITTTNTTTTTIKPADKPIHHLLPRHQRHQLHPMQPTRHPLHSFTPVSTSNPLRVTIEDGSQMHTMHGDLTSKVHILLLKFVAPSAILASHGVAFMAPYLSTSTPKKSSSSILHIKPHSAQPSSATHTAPNSPSSHTSPPSQLKRLPRSQSSIHAVHGGLMLTPLVLLQQCHAQDSSLPHLNSHTQYPQSAPLLTPTPQPPPSNTSMAPAGTRTAQFATRSSPDRRFSQLISESIRERRPLAPTTAPSASQPTAHAQLTNHLILLRSLCVPTVW